MCCLRWGIRTATFDSLEIIREKNARGEPTLTDWEVVPVRCKSVDWLNVVELV